MAHRRLPTEVVPGTMLPKKVFGHFGKLDGGLFIEAAGEQQAEEKPTTRARA